MKRKIISLVMAFLILTSLAACSKSGTSRIEESMFAFDTYMTFCCIKWTAFQKRTGCSHESY